MSKIVEKENTSEKLKRMWKEIETNNPPNERIRQLWESVDELMKDPEFQKLSDR